MFDIKKLQDQQEVWAKKNFGSFGPDHNPAMTLLGITEEIGELTEVLDRYMTLSENWGTILPDLLDSIAGIVVFSADYCTGKGWDMQELYDAAVKLGSNSTVRSNYLEINEAAFFSEINALLRVMSKANDRLNHHQLKSRQNIRGSAEKHIAGGRENLTILLRALMDVCELIQQPFLKVVEDTWSVVRQRDWTKKTVEPGVESV